MTTMLDRGDGARLAYDHRAGAAPTIVFLPGYASDMGGTKALALDAWAERHGRALLRLDYAGCGASEGAFEDGTLASWRDDALTLIDRLTQGPLILVGSSMGGWIALLIALARPERTQALLGIAAAPDFTDWGFTDAERAAIRAEGRIHRASDYGDPLATTRAFWESGEAHRLLDAPIPIPCPVRLIQGQQDADVPWEIALRLAARLGSADVQTILVKDGDHRLSRAQDLALIEATLAALLETP